MRRTLFFIISIFVFLRISAQQADYILHSFDYKTPVTAVNISPDEKWILAGFEDGTLRIIDIHTLLERLVIEGAVKNPIFDIEMSPVTDFIYIASGSIIALFDTLGNRTSSLRYHRNTIWSMDISPDGKYLASTEVNKTFQLYNIPEGKIEQSMRAHDDITFAVAFSHDGRMLASGSNDKKVFLWSMDTRKVIKKFQGHSDNIYDVAFSPDGSLIAAASKDETVRIWNIKENRLVHILDGHQGIVFEIEFSPDGKYLASTSSDQAIKLWDVRTGEQLYPYLENEGSAPDIEFMPDGKSFVSACMDGTLKIWEINPEIFVMKYYGDAYEKELELPLFKPRQKGEKRADYEERVNKAKRKKQTIIEKY